MANTIIYIGGFELPDKNAAAHRVLNNAKALRELGKNVVLIGITHEAISESMVCNTRKSIYGFDCYTIPYPKTVSQWLKYLMGIEPYIEICKTYQNVSAVVLYDFPAIAIQKMISYCRKRNIKCYGDSTEWYSARGRGIVYAVLKSGDTFYRMRILNKKLDGRIVISRYLQEYYKKGRNTICIPPLIDISEEKWKNPYIKQKETLLLVYAGSPGLKDRIDILIDALQKVRRAYHLDIIGITLDEYLMRAPQHKSFLQGNQSIIFHGRKPHLDALQYVKRANYSCFFRIVERVTMAGFPTKFAEAVSCGTPVLTNSTSNLSDYCKKGMNGYLVESIDRDVIAEALEKIPYTMKTQIDEFDYHKYIGEFKKCFAHRHK